MNSQINSVTVSLNGLNGLSRSQLREIIASNSLQISALLEENKFLSQENNRLREENLAWIKAIKNNEESIELLKQKNKELNDEVSKLNNELKIIKEIVVNLSAEITDIKVQKEFEKLQYAIQDINSDEKLEGSFRYLTAFRRGRIDNAHFIYEDDSESLKKYKKKLVYDRLIKAQRNDNLKSRFNPFPKLLSDISQHLARYSLENGADISEEERIIADAWFN